MSQQIAIVTGITGMDGSLLVEQLTSKGIKVYGIIRRSSRGFDLGCSAGQEKNPLLEVIEADLTDMSSLLRIIKKTRPDYFYNMGAMSHVQTSFDQPILTAQVNAIGVLNCLEAIRQSGIFTKFLTASTSEMYGGISDEPATETTPFHPRSPYGVAKLFGYWATVNYRESYKMFAANTICFNHEQPGKRGSNFVTRKITLGVAAIKAGLQDKLFLGNLKAKRDWGLARDYTEGMMMVMEAAQPDDYVLATGETHSVEEFCEIAFEYAGLGDYKQYVEIDPNLYRPAEVNVLIGDYSKIEKALGWKPKTKFVDLVKQMVDYDLKGIK